MRSNKGRSASRQSTGASGLEMWAAAELNSKCKRKAQSLTNNAALMDLFVLLMNASSIEITLGNAWKRGILHHRRRPKFFELHIVTIYPTPWNQLFHPLEHANNDKIDHENFTLGTIYCGAPVG